MQVERKEITEFLETAKQVDRAFKAAIVVIAAIVLTTLIMVL
jgi:hypothetical protein